MKLNFYFCAAMLIMASCASQQDDAMNFFDESETNISSNRTIADAINIAKHAVTLLPTNSRSGVCVDENDVIVICNPTSSRSGKSDTLLYAVNNEDNKGFTLVAAPKNVEPIIAVTEEGSYNSVETLSNESFQYALEAAKSYVSEKSITTDTVKITPIRTEDIEHFQTPRVSVKWGQKWPQNIYCSNNVAGCVPVAIGQICTHFEQPAKINLSFSGKDQDSQILNWTDIKSHINSERTLGFDTTKSIIMPKPAKIQSIGLYCTASDSTHKAIGRLVRQIGELAHSCYVSDSSDGNYTCTTEGNGMSALKTLLPDRYYNNLFNVYSNLYNKLKNEGIAIFFGKHIYENDTEIGHCWVADATGEIEHIIYEDQTESDGTITTTKTVSTTQYFHFNWGWYGNSNGYFSVGVFNTKAAYKYDNSNNTANYNFANDVSFTYIK